MNKISKFFYKKLLLLELKFVKRDLEVYEQEIKRLNNKKTIKINLKELQELNKELNNLKKEQQKDSQELADLEEELKNLQEGQQTYLQEFLDRNDWKEKYLKWLGFIAFLFLLDCMLFYLTFESLKNGVWTVK